MIERYKVAEVESACSDEARFKRFTKVELAVCKARVKLGKMTSKEYSRIAKAMANYEPDCKWIAENERLVTGHDFTSYLGDCQKHIPEDLHQHWHPGTTTFDTQDPAFVLMLQDLMKLFWDEYNIFVGAIKRVAEEYRYTLMGGYSHGQFGELQTFGKRFLSYLAPLLSAGNILRKNCAILNYSKMAGAMGNNATVGKDLEKEALRVLKRKPYRGVSQIMNRTLYLPMYQSLGNIMRIIENMAYDLWLGARSDHPITQEPFAEGRQGSSAMAHKRNPVKWENMFGLAVMLMAYISMLEEVAITFEERDIRQSSVERVAIPGIFHLLIYALRTMSKILDGLEVYPDQMLFAIVDSRGSYASNMAKEFLKNHRGEKLKAKDCYQIVQLASFNALEPAADILSLRHARASSPKEAAALFEKAEQINRSSSRVSIRDIIRSGWLRPNGTLTHPLAIIESWNIALKEIFENNDFRQAWDQLFEVSQYIENEPTLEEIFDNP